MAFYWRHGLAVLACLAGPGCVQQTLLCQRPEVLQEVGRAIRLSNHYNVLDENSAIEAPTAQANAVTCQAVMTTVGYEPTRTGWEPRPVRQWLRYAVQVSDNRFVVQVLP